jgi:hypothetical protein
MHMNATLPASLVLCMFSIDCAELHGNTHQIYLDMKHTKMQTYEVFVSSVPAYNKNQQRIRGKNPKGLNNVVRIYILM